jgi:GMP synthase-like glutamine amidotransferase
MRVLTVVHGPLVAPELFGEVIEAAGHELVEWQIEAGEGPPADPDAVVVFGGHQNVGEEALYPWLEDEYALLRGWVASATPLLGICLGAQTLAHAFGGPVARAPQRLAGFYPVSLTEAGRRDAVLGVLPARFEALFANAYAFALPPGAVELAAGPGAPAAFRVGELAWALQFHPEARLDQVLGWLAADGESPRPMAEIEAELSAGIERWHELGRALCGAFLARAQAAREPAQLPGASAIG